MGRKKSFRGDGVCLVTLDNLSLTSAKRRERRLEKNCSGAWEPRLEGLETTTMNKAGRGERTRGVAVKSRRRTEDNSCCCHAEGRRGGKKAGKKNFLKKARKREKKGNSKIDGFDIAFARLHLNTEKKREEENGPKKKGKGGKEKTGLQKNCSFNRRAVLRGCLEFSISKRDGGCNQERRGFQGSA